MKQVIGLILLLIASLYAVEDRRAASFARRDLNGAPEALHGVGSAPYVDSDTHFVLVDTLDLPDEFAPGPGQFSRDGLKFFLGLSRGTGSDSVYVLCRERVSDPFGPPTLLAGGVNVHPDSLPATNQPSITADGRILVFVRSDGFWSGTDLYLATRVDTGVPFDSVRALDEMNLSGAADCYPCISADGLSLYFTQDTDLVVASRESTRSQFGPPRSLSIHGYDIFSAWLTDDELELYFVDRPDIYYAWRTSREDTFSTPVIHPEFSGLRFVSGPSMFGREFCLYNSSDGDRILVFGPSPAGIEEETARLGPSARVATVLRRAPFGKVVFDAMGRRVASAKPGVYFVRTASGVGRQASSVRKVVVQH